MFCGVLVWTFHYSTMKLTPVDAQFRSLLERYVSCISQIAKSSGVPAVVVA